MFGAIKNIRALVALANDIAANAGDGPRWSLYLTNRSFIALVIAVTLNIAAVLGVPVVGALAEIAPDVLAGHVVEVVTALLVLWSFVERLVGKTRVIWSRKQAVKAVEEAKAIDPLTDALRGAGAPAVQP